jgi:hypothetical protein
MKYLAALFLAPVLSQATTIFDGYEAYYASLPNRIFQSPGIKLEPYSVLGDDTTRFGWHGMAAGRQQKVEVRDGQLKLNGRPLALKLVKTFPDEVANNMDLDRGTIAYFEQNWTCVENTPSSASGTAVRHQAVYLIRHKGKKQEIWKLPSLFASCVGVRLQNNLVHFDKAEYRYQDEQEEPQGLVLKEYIIQGNKFVATGNRQLTNFVEPGNVYKFSVKTGTTPAVQKVE